MHAVAAVAVAAAAPAYRLPAFSWDTLPVAFHSSNVTGMYSDDEISVLAKFPVVTVEKYQDLHGLLANGYNWESCSDIDAHAGTQNVTNCGCCEEDHIAEIGRRVKAINRDVMVLAYMNTEHAYPWYRFGHDLAAQPQYWLRNSTGGLVAGGAGHWPDTDWSQDGAAEMWTGACLNMTTTGYVDGCFIDGCTHSTGGLSPEKHAAFLPNKLAHLRQLQQAVPGPMVCGSNGAVDPGLAASQIQNWGKAAAYSKREIPMLQRAVARGAMFEAHGRCPSNASDPATVTSVAAFLVAAGPHSYYMCGGWNGAVPTWFPIYDLPLGAPLANATLSGGVYTRAFSSGTRATYDTATETGTIVWGK